MDQTLAQLFHVIFCLPPKISKNPNLNLNGFSAIVQYQIISHRKLPNITRMPQSRKKAKGKARKAAKAQQQEEVAAAAADERGSLHSQLRGSGGGNSCDQRVAIRKCQHGFGKDTFHGSRVCNDFMGPFMDAFNASGRHDDQDLRAAMDATYEKYTEVWKDPAKLEWVISCFIANGTRYILEGTGEGGEDKYAIKDYAIIAYYMEEYVAVMLRKTHERMEWDKICELQVGSDPEEHKLVKFYHARNPCKCLEKLFREGEKKAKAMKDKEVKTLKKVLDFSRNAAESEEDEDKRQHYCGEINNEDRMNDDSGLGYWKSLTENALLGNLAEISPSSLN